jgi:hypothetical protein
VCNSLHAKMMQRELNILSLFSNLPLLFILLFGVEELKTDI